MTQALSIYNTQVNAHCLNHLTMHFSHQSLGLAFPTRVAFRHSLLYNLTYIACIISHALFASIIRASVLPSRVAFRHSLLFSSGNHGLGHLPSREPIPVRWRASGLPGFPACIVTSSLLLGNPHSLTSPGVRNQDPVLSEDSHNRDLAFNSYYEGTYAISFTSHHIIQALIQSHIQAKTQLCTYRAKNHPCIQATTQGLIQSCIHFNYHLNHHE